MMEGIFFSWARTMGSASSSTTSTSQFSSARFQMSCRWQAVYNLSYPFLIAHLHQRSGKKQHPEHWQSHLSLALLWTGTHSHRTQKSSVACKATPICFSTTKKICYHSSCEQSFAVPSQARLNSNSLYLFIFGTEERLGSKPAPFSSCSLFPCFIQYPIPLLILPRIHLHFTTGLKN